MPATTAELMSSETQMWQYAAFLTHRVLCPASPALTRLMYPRGRCDLSPERAEESFAGLYHGALTPPPYAFAKPDPVT
jgi:hypothetical protein